jgi:hypothetical protein
VGLPTPETLKPLDCPISSSRSNLLPRECIALLKRSAKYAYKTSAVIVQLTKNATQQLWLPRQVADKVATAILVATVVML